MKKHLLLLLTLMLTLPLAAQTDGGAPVKKKKHPEITEVVSDLSAPQKHKIETITHESRQRTDALRQQQRAVRDSIKTIMDIEGDQSRTLFPLFDREAALQAAVSREMYTTKLRIDAILTPGQRATLRKGRK